MQSIGIDLGTTFIKTSNERIFPSGISENIYQSNNVMKIDNKKYAMGLFSHKAIFDININKCLNKNARLNFIYALFQEGNGVDCIFQNVIVGLPCSQWKNDATVKSFKQLLDISDILTVSVNNLEKRILVENIEVIPEGSSAYYAMDYKKFEGRKAIILDWGSLTLNQILFSNDEIIDMHTDEFGVLKVYKDMAEAITSKTGIDVKLEDMLEILQFGLFDNSNIIYVDEIVKPIAMDFCREVYKSLKLKWNINTIPFILMIGAGSITMHKYLSEDEFVPHAELQNNAQLLTSIGMNEMVGD